MKQKDTDSNETERTKRLAEELGKHPQLREQVEAILWDAFWDANLAA